MKNGCLIVDNGLEGMRSIPILDVFYQDGYTFSEIRTIPFNNEKIRNVLLQMQTEYSNLFLLIEKEQAGAIRKGLLADWQEMTIQTEQGAGIFINGQCCLFLLFLNDEKNGATFAKETCAPYLRKRSGKRIEKIVLRTVGANYERIEQLIIQSKGLDGGKLNYLHTRKYDEDVIRIFYGDDVSKMLTDDVLRLFLDGLGDTVYAMSDTPLPNQLIELLRVRGKKISVAESFTGGGIAKKLSSVSGASAVYFEGLNTYNELSKMQRLGVKDFTLKTFGAVSDQTAYEMATGLLNTGNCDICITTTGLAGPNTDKSNLPVGLCYVAVGTKEKIFVYRYKFDGTREEITEKAIQYALFLAYKQLKNM